MPTVTINIVGARTPTSDNPSVAGHMWYSLTDSNGNTASYGFSPIASATGKDRASGSGKVNAHGQDDTYYKGPRDFTKTIEITQDQYDNMKQFGENPEQAGFSLNYNALSNSCIDFTWKAMSLGGLNPTEFEGALWPTLNGNSVTDIVNAANGLFHGFMSGFSTTISYDYLITASQQGFAAARAAR